MENNRRDTKTSLAFLNVKCLPVTLSKYVDARDS